MILRAACLFAALLALGTPVSSAPKWDAARYMGLDEIQPGMRGVGRSVFRGTAIDTFSVEILGVLPTASPGGEMILAQLSGQGLEESGIIAGMSGSPVYVDGRLIGAVAFGWSYSKQPIGGITPIASMLSLEERAGAKLEGSTAATPQWGGLPVEQWTGLLGARGHEAFAHLQRPVPAVGEDLVPLSLPAVYAGLGPLAGGELSRILGAGLVAVPGAGTDPGAPTLPLEPGSPLGVALVTGDAQVAAIGTVTWIEGDRVLAFGHPMMSMGATAYPMTSASILAVMPRVSTSFKMGVTGPVLGSITRDYRAGVMGTLSASPRMIPMEVTLDFAGRSKTLHYEILEADALTASLAGLMALNSVESFGRSSGASTIRMESEVRLADGQKVTTGSWSAGFSPPLAFAGEFARLVGLIHGNPFAPVKIDHLAVRASVADSIDVSFLVRAGVPARSYHAGDELAVELVFRDYRGDEHARVETLPLPESLAPGRYQLSICDGVEAAREEAERAPDRYAPRTLSQLLARLNQETSRDELVFRVLSTTPTSLVAGHELPGLPRSLKATMASPSAGGRVTASKGTVVISRRQALDRGVVGCQRLEFTVVPSPQ